VNWRGKKVEQKEKKFVIGNYNKQNKKHGVAGSEKCLFFTLFSLFTFYSFNYLILLIEL